MSTWFEHRYALGRALSRLAGRPTSSLLSAAVIAIALSLPALGLVLLDNVARLARGVSGKPEISVFFKLDTARAQAEALAAQLGRDARVSALRLVGREDALRELSAAEGLADVAPLLADNPLPDALVLEPRDSSPQAFEALRSELSARPEVELVQLDSAWVARLHALVAFGRQASVLLALLFGAALVIISFNTIRLQILTQRHEIAVSLLLGASSAFVRRPFVYFGLLQGALGGLLACASVIALAAVLLPPLQVLATSYSVVLDVTGLQPTSAAALVLFATLLGGLGAALSVRAHLHDGLVD